MHSGTELHDHSDRESQRGPVAGDQRGVGMCVAMWTPDSGPLCALPCAECC